MSKEIKEDSFFNKYIMIFLVIMAMISFVIYYVYKEITNIKQYIKQQNMIEERNRIDINQIDEKVDKMRGIFKSMLYNRSNNEKLLKENVNDVNVQDAQDVQDIQEDIREDIQDTNDDVNLNENVNEEEEGQINIL